MIEVAKAVGSALATFGALYGMALFIGNGRCHDCGRFTVPWSVYCGRHRP